MPVPTLPATAPAAVPAGPGSPRTTQARQERPLTLSSPDRGHVAGVRRAAAVAESPDSAGRRSWLPPGSLVAFMTRL